MALFPNPASDFLDVTGTEKIIFIEISDLTSRVVHQEGIDKHSFNLDVTFLPEGLYIMKIQFSDKKFSVQKFIVAR
jgi:hypothetical protein